MTFNQLHTKYSKVRLGLWLFMAYVFSVARVVAQGVVPASQHANDSLYRHISREMFAQSAFYLNYPQGRSFIVRDLGNNASELDRLKEFIHVALHHPNLYVDHIYLTGYSSVEGSYALNNRLSRERVEQLYIYLNEQHPDMFKYDHSIAHIGEDWRGLIQMIRASALPEKEEILSIIRKVPGYDERERLLRQLNGGASYRYMEQHFFSLSRKVELRVEYRLTPKVMPAVSEALIIETMPTNYTEEKYNFGLPTSQLAAKIADDPTWTQRLAAATVIKLDLLPTLVGVPSAGIEFFPASRWSVAVHGSYARWVFSGDSRELYHWNVTPEVRHYLSSKGPAAPRLFAGAYYNKGEFDIRLGSPNGRMGQYWGAGLSLGVSGPVFPERNHRFLWEVALGVGYNRVEYDKYRFDSICKVYTGSNRRVLWGPSFVRFSLAYRLGNPKGGRK